MSRFFRHCPVPVNRASASISPGRRTALFAPFIAALTLALLGVNTLAQPLVMMTPGQYMRGQLVGAVVEAAAAIGAMAADNQRMGREIAEARREFWASREGPQREAAADKLEKALIRKELRFVSALILNFGQGRNSAAGIAMRATGSYTVDGGILPYCDKTFDVWADAVTTAAGMKGATQESVFRHAMPQYIVYRAEREIAEFLFLNPDGILRASDPEPQTYLAAWLLGTKYVTTAPEANAEAARITVAVGETRMREIVRVLRSWSTVTREIEGPIKGPWRGRARAVLDPLFAGRFDPPVEGEWPDFRQKFSELRGRVAVPQIQLAGAMDALQATWMSARQTKDHATLRRAVEQRDEFIQQLDRAIVNNINQLVGGEGKLTMSMTQLNLQFMDYYLVNMELNAARSGKMNPRGAIAQKTSEEFLARGDDKASGPSSPARSVEHKPAAAPTLAAAGAGGAQAPVVPAIPMHDPADPFGRAIALARDPKAMLISSGHLSDSLHILARSWSSYAYAKEAYALKNLIAETRMLCVSLKQAIDAEQKLLDGPWGKVPERRNISAPRMAALKAVLDELNARILDFEKAAAPKGG